jgi:hypothetical protein
MITWHARVYNLRKYRATAAYRIKPGKSGTRRSPDAMTPMPSGEGQDAALRRQLESSAKLQAYRDVVRALKL